jgi:hypothetical protein
VPALRLRTGSSERGAACNGGTGALASSRHRVDMVPVRSTDGSHQYDRARDDSVRTPTQKNPFADGPGP